jgi:quinol monooxygenase YgiN
MNVQTDQGAVFMSDKQVAMILRIHPPTESREEVKAALLALVEPSRREPGCIRYELYKDIDRDGDLVLVEAWRDQAALDEHIAKPYLQDFTKRYADIFRDAITSGLTRIQAI